MRSFEAILATAKGKGDFTLRVLSALFLVACSGFFIMLGVYTFFHTANLPYAGTVKFIAFLLIITGWFISPIWVFSRGDCHGR